MNKEELLLECKQRYPVGTKYTITSGSNTYVITNEDTFHYGWYGKDNIYVKNNNGCGRSGFIYKEGEWAEIIESPNLVVSSFPIY